jgi:hypothetical protein
MTKKDARELQTGVTGDTYNGDLTGISHFMPERETGGSRTLQSFFGGIRAIFYWA